MVFSVWNDLNDCLSWKETKEFTDLLGLETVPVLYQGVFNEKDLVNLAKKIDKSKVEGFVVRVASSFQFRDFKNSVAKFVRKNHVTTHGHWTRSKLIPNKLKK